MELFDMPSLVVATGSKIVVPCDNLDSVNAMGSGQHNSHNTNTYLPVTVVNSILVYRPIGV